MTDSLAAVLAVCWVWGGGVGLRTLAKIPRETPSREIPRALVLGVAVCGIAAPLAAWMGIHASWGAAAALGCLCVAGWVGRERRERAPALNPNDRWGTAVVAIPLAAAAFFSFDSPMVFGDEVTVWGYKSAAIATTGRIDPTQWTQWVSRGPNYPVSVPTAGSLASLAVAEFAPAGCRALALAGFLAFALAIGELLGLLVSGVVRAAGALALASLPRVLGESYSFMGDLWLTAGIALAASSALRAAKGRDAILLLAALPLLKLDGIPIAAGLAIVGVLARPRETRWRWLAALAVAAALASGPWLTWCLRCGVSPASGDPLGHESRSGEMAGILREPSLALSRVGTVAVALLDALFVRGGLIPRGPFGAPFLFLPWTAALLAFLGNPATSVRRSWLVAAAIAIFLGQAVPLALAPNFAWQLEVVRDRAALHLLPAVILVAAALRRLDPSLPDP